MNESEYMKEAQRLVDAYVAARNIADNLFDTEEREERAERIASEARAALMSHIAKGEREVPVLSERQIAFHTGMSKSGAFTVENVAGYADHIAKGEQARAVPQGHKAMPIKALRRMGALIETPWHDDLAPQVLRRIRLAWDEMHATRSPTTAGQQAGGGEDSDGVLASNASDEDPHVMSALNAGVPRAAVEISWLLQEDMQDLQRFYETCEDSQPYDVPKDRMRRLAELGVIQWCGGARYSITAFGQHVLDLLPEGWPRLPLKTHADHDAYTNAQLDAACGVQEVGRG